MNYPNSYIKPTKGEMDGVVSEKEICKGEKKIGAGGKNYYYTRKSVFLGYMQFYYGFRHRYDRNKDVLPSVKDNSDTLWKRINPCRYKVKICKESYPELYPPLLILII